MRKIVFAYENRTQEPAIRYAASLLLDAVMCEWRSQSYADLPDTLDADAVLSYGAHPPDRVSLPMLHIVESKFFQFSSLCSSDPVFVLTDSGLPVMGDTTETRIPSISECVVTSKDFLATAFYCATRCEEQQTSGRDAAGRFRAADSVASRYQVLSRPMVDEFVDHLLPLFNAIGVPVSRRSLCGSRPFGVCLTHDIDTVSRGWMEALNAVLFRSHCSLRERILRSGKVISERIKRGDLYWNFDVICALEDKYSARSTFFFLPPSKDPRDGRYSIFSKPFRQLFSQLELGGWEVGLHGSYQSAFQDGRLKQEKRQLERLVGHEVSGIRQHFLRFELPEGWHRQRHAGFKYDTTLGYAETPGFRAGLARPFYVFNFQDSQGYPLVEIPLVIMDSTFRNYQRISPKHAWVQIESLLTTVKRHRGIVSILWHNNFFTDYKYAGFFDLYEQILHWVSSAGGSFFTGQETIDLLQQNIEPSGGGGV